MRGPAKIIGSICLSLICTAELAADEQADAARFEQLLHRLENVVPPGWSVSFKLANPERPARLGSHPALMIRSDTPLPVEHFYAGMAFTSPDEPPEPPKISREAVTVYFVATPFLPAEQYAEARRRNEALRRKRIAFQNKRLQNIPWAHKGPRPIPPQAYRPRNDAETRRIRQYAFHWLSTRPKPLPTHFVENLSFRAHMPGSLKIHDAKKSKEYEQILESVQKIITPYEVSD